jgi:L-arabinose isomerase
MVAAMHTLCGQANFSEMYMMDLKRDAILLCHAGEGNWKTCRKDQKPFLMDRVFNEGGLSNPPTPILRRMRAGRASSASYTLAASASASSCRTARCRSSRS